MPPTALDVLREWVAAQNEHDHTPFESPAMRAAESRLAAAVHAAREMVTTGATRGRKPGQLMPGSLSWHLSRLKPGDVLWTSQPSEQVESTAGRRGLNVRTQRCYAVATRPEPTLHVVTRITRLPEETEP